LANADETAKSGTSLGKGRMEAFSDGVLAIAITLLVLDLALRPPGSPTHEFLRAWPSYVAYVVSFLTIGGAWIAHNALTERLDRVDSIFLRLNLLFLLSVAFLPYPTRLVAEALERNTDWERLAVTVYGLTILAVRLMFAVLVSYSRREHLGQERAEDPDLREARRKSGFTLIGYCVAILVGLLLPIVAIAFYFALAVFLVVPFRTVARELFRRAPSP
jgi:uncharacterized membrane protein